MIKDYKLTLLNLMMVIALSFSTYANYIAGKESWWITLIGVSLVGELTIVLFLLERSMVGYRKRIADCDVKINQLMTEIIHILDIKKSEVKE